MALNNYANLKQAIENWSKRTDITNVLDDFIDLAESKIDADLLMRANETRTNLTITAGSRFVALPADYLQARAMYIAGNRNYRLTYESPEAMEIENESGRPTKFTITSQIELNAIPDGTYTASFAYVAQLSALSTANPTNNVLTKYPDLYLYGSLAALHRWARDEQTAMFYDGMFEACMVKAKRQEEKGRYGPAPVMRKGGRTP